MIPYSNAYELFFLLIAGHAIADFGIQSEFVATNKNRHARSRFSTEAQSKMQVIWPHLLMAHCLHHSFFVILLTGSYKAALAEFFAHIITDFGKCENWYGFHADQAVHIVTKVLWTYCIVSGIF